MSTPAEIALGGVVGTERVDRLEAILRYPADIFTDVTVRRVVAALTRYHSRYRAVLPTQALPSYLVDDDAEVQAGVAHLWVAFRDLQVPDDQFQWALSTLVDDYRQAQGSQALATAAGILLEGAPVPDGKGGQRVVRGFEEAREFLLGDLSRIQGATLLDEASPSVNLSSSLDTTLGLLGSAQTGVRFSTGIPAIDEATNGGPKLGTLWFVAAFAGEGKTTFSINLAYQAIMQGLNVVYLTGETLLSTVLGRLVCRHSRAPQFGLPGGLSYQEVMVGNLSDEARAAFAATAQDLNDGALGGTYGELMVEQMPLRHTIEGVQDTLRSMERSRPVHVLVVDSIDMVRAQGPYGFSYREVLSETIEQFARLAVAYEGRGLCVISPYQVNRVSYNEALENSARYSLSALSETAMAERRASVVVSLLRLPENPGTLRAQLLKNREGPVADFDLDIDDRSSYIGTGAGAMAQALGGVADPFSGLF